MKAMILGCDGYLGWPTMLYFSNRGYSVLGVDNFLKRHICKTLKEESLFPLKRLNDRIKVWNNNEFGPPIEIKNLDITNYEALKKTIAKFEPEIIVDYAEIPSGPYSMISQQTAYNTLVNNTVGTMNLAWALKEINPSIHLIKLGTAGEWGTPNTPIPEGFFEFTFMRRKDKRLFPREAGSFYHTTKILDTDILWFFVRNWNLRVTDLMQGPVIGMHTDETRFHKDLHTCFHYGEVWGTVVNRFVTQVVADYPLTIYGKGGQTRGYLNILDTMQCVYLAATNPPAHGELQIMNQMTQTFSVNQLAELVQKAGEKMRYRVRVQHLDNPRIEKEEHYYNIIYTKLRDLGLEPHYLTEDTICEMIQTIEPFYQKINHKSIFVGYKWQ